MQQKGQQDKHDGLRVALKVMFALFKILTRAARATANVRQDDIPSL